MVSPGCLVELACATLAVWMLGRGSLTFPARIVVWPAAPFVSVEGVCVSLGGQGILAKLTPVSF